MYSMVTIPQENDSASVKLKQPGEESLRHLQDFLPLLKALGGLGTTRSSVFFVSFGQTLFSIARSSLSFSLRLSEKQK